MSFAFLSFPSSFELKNIWLFRLRISPKCRIFAAGNNKRRENIMYKTREELIAHLREVKRRKEEWQREAKAEYQQLMKDTEVERERIHAAIANFD